MCDIYSSPCPLSTICSPSSGQCWVRLDKVNHKGCVTQGFAPGQRALSCQHQAIDCCPHSNTPYTFPLAPSISLAQDREQLTARERAMSSYYHSQHGARCRQTGRTQTGGTPGMCLSVKSPLCFPALPHSPGENNHVSIRD